MVKLPSVHEIRCATIKWCYENTHVARNGLRAREYAMCSVPNVGSKRSRADLLDILDQLRSELAPFHSEDDEAAEPFDYMLGNWDYESHLKVVDAVERLRLDSLAVEWLRKQFKPNEVLDRLVAVDAAERRQSSLETLLPALVGEEPENEMAGAW